MIDVLVVEDSRVTLDYLVYLLTGDPEIRVVATAPDGERAIAYLQQRRPDVVLMDIQMPGIDGFETTRRIMTIQPVPIVLCTASLNPDDVNTAMRGLEAGAVAVVRKPRGPAGDPAADVQAAELIRMLKLMAEVVVVRRWRRGFVDRQEVSTAPSPMVEPRDDMRLVAIGASTGGPPVVRDILSALPPVFPIPILVVQHIAPGFTQGFVEWLATASGPAVSLARDGETPCPGHVYVAPDHHHLCIGSPGELRTTQDAPHSGLRPSVSVLFRSVALRCGRHAVGVLLSGMGRDGADELKLMSDTGAITVAQDEETCVVFGMPGEAIRVGAAQHVLPPPRIAALLLNVAQQARV